MNEVIAWATFAGAWLLVAGPLYQGSVELGELDFDREGVEGIKASAVQVAENRPSPWWWWWLAAAAGLAVLAAVRGDAYPGRAQHRAPDVQR